MSTAEELLKKYESEIGEFEKWIETQPRLPKNIDKLLLFRHLKVYDFDLEKAKNLLVVNLETRKKSPQIFLNRDVRSTEFQAALSTMQCLALPKNTKDNHKVSIFRLVDTDPNNFNYVDIIRCTLTLLDIRLVYYDPNGEPIDGEIGIIDISGFGFRHFTKVIANLSTFKAYSSYAQEAAPIKIIQNHFINCSPILEKLLAVMKPFLKKEVIESMKIHSTLESLYEYVPKNILPTEYGGTEFSLSELTPFVNPWLEEKREYILNDDNWKIED